MKIHDIQRLCIPRYIEILAKEPEKRKIYVDLIFSHKINKIVHILSTEYINIWYAACAIDTRYTRSYTESTTQRSGGQVYVYRDY